MSHVPMVSPARLHFKTGTLTLLITAEIGMVVVFGLRINKALTILHYLSGFTGRIRDCSSQVLFLTGTSGSKN